MLEKIIMNLKMCQDDVVKEGLKSKEYTESTMVFKVSYWIEEAVRVLEEMKKLRIIREEG